MKTTKPALRVESLEDRALPTAGWTATVAAPPPVAYESALIYVAQPSGTRTYDHAIGGGILAASPDDAVGMHHCNIDRLYH